GKVFDPERIVLSAQAEGLGTRTDRRFSGPERVVHFCYRTNFARPIADRIAATAPPAPAASMRKSRRSRSKSERFAPVNLPFGGGIGIATSSTSYSPVVAGGGATTGGAGGGALASDVAGAGGAAVASAFGSGAAGGLGLSVFFGSLTIFPTGTSVGGFAGFASFFAGAAGSWAASGGRNSCSARATRSGVG